MSDNKTILQEQDQGYEKAEMDLLRDGLRRTHTQRYDMLVQLIKVGVMLKNAKITHQPYNLSERKG